MKFWTSFIAGAAFALTAISAGAQAWPTRPVKIIVPFPPGTVTDTTTRIVAPALSAALGQPVLVDNRPGADGAIGAQEVARSAPDGYTLLMSTNGFSAIPALRKVSPYDPLKDFTPVSMVARFSFFLFVNSEVPVKTVAELMDYARANPGKLNYATGNPTGIVASSQMLSLAKARMVQVPYKGEPAAMTDLASNRVQVMFATLTTAGPHLQSGKLRMLATTLPQRSPAYPDVPTMQEAGITNFAVASWAALQGPEGMPADIAQRLSREVAAALAQPEVREALLKQNVIPASSTPDELAAYVRSQVDLYARTLKEAGVQPSEVHPPLAGTLVLDLTRILAGPWCTQMLADFGAEVIKIERPQVGDDTRSWGPPWLDAADGTGRRDAAYFGAANRNKKSVAADISTPEGQDLVRRIAARADVLVENFKVGDLARHGLDYVSLRQINPSLIYCSITGYGQTGPYAQRPGYDFIFQAEAGLMSVTGERDDRPGGGPQKVGVAVADLVTGMYACSGILAALNRRRLTGEGQAIDVALFDSTLAFGANLAFNHVVSGAVPSRFGNGHPVLVPYQVFRTADGSVVVAAGNDTQWQRFCRAIQRADLAADDRYRTGPGRIEHRDALLLELEKTFLTRTSAEWLVRLETEDVPHGNINNYKQAFEHPQALHRRMRVDMPSCIGGSTPGVANPVRFSQTPVRYVMPPPALGQHTDEIRARFAPASSS